MSELTIEQLREKAKKLNLTVPPKIGIEKLEEMVQVAIYKKEIELKEKAKAERAKDVSAMLSLDPQTKAKPAPETIAIANSKKVYALFTNLQDEGADIEFNKGCTHTFHLYHDYLHVLPQYLIDECKDLKSPIGKRPIHGMRRNPNSSVDNMSSQIIGHKRRYTYETYGDAPQDAKFGVILDKAIYDKLGVPFPEAA